MKTLSPEFQAHLDGGTTTLAWCWRIVRADGAVYGFTDHDRALAFGGTDYEPDSGLAASEIRAGTDLAVDAQDAEGVLSTDTIAEADILAGLWDNAAVELWRVNWSDTGQRALLRAGNIGEMRRGRVAFVAEIRSLAHRLAQTVGRTYQSTCDARLGDARCGVDLTDAAYRGVGTVTDAGDGRIVGADGLSAFEGGWFVHGVLSWETGANAGLASVVTGHTLTAGGVSLTLVETAARTVAAGDTFAIRAGCDKAHGTCAAKFANTDNFRGFPDMPDEGLILRYAASTDENSGRVL